MVCLGNICRSPMAEGILRNKVQSLGFDWEIDSAGTGAYHTGAAPHIFAQKVAGLHGIDLSGLRARKFRKEDMLYFDRIYVMDSENFQDVKNISQELWRKEKTEFLLNECYPGENRGVPDPWYGKEKDFREVYNLIEKACTALLTRIVSQRGDPAIAKDFSKLQPENEA